MSDATGPKCVTHDSCDCLSQNPKRRHALYSRLAAVMGDAERKRIEALGTVGLEDPDGDDGVDDLVKEVFTNVVKRLPYLSMADLTTIQELQREVLHWWHPMYYGGDRDETGRKLRGGDKC